MCSFEEPTGICRWSQDKDNNIDWKLGQGATGSFNTGPKRDHTLGLPSGHYIFLESSYPAVEGDRARIASPVMNNTGISCEFRFYWHMYGEVNIHLDFEVRFRTQNVFLFQIGYWFTQCLYSNNLQRTDE